MDAGLKIPRAHACPSSSGSEQLIVDAAPEHLDTLPSDYPSESRSCSEVEEGDIRCVPSVSSAGREEMQMINQAYIPEDDVECLSSVYSDAHAQFDVDVFGLPTVIPRVDPCFDVAFRVRPQSPVPSSATSVTSVESDVSRAQLLQSQERALTTILEREEWRVNDVTKLQAKLQPGQPLHPPADCIDAPPVDYAQVVRKPRSTLSQRSIPENETWSVTEHEELPAGRMPLSPSRSLASLNTEMTDPHSIGEMVMKSSCPVERQPQESLLVQTQLPDRKKTLVVNEDIQLHTTVDRQVTDDDEKETMIVPTPERPIPPPKVTTQEVDDVYLKTITETRIMEESERIRRKMTEYHQRPKPSRKQQAPLPPNWDVTIRQHPPAPQSRAPSESTNWDDASTIDPANPQWDVKIRQYPPAPYQPRTPSESTNWDEMSQVFHPRSFRNSNAITQFISSG